MTISNKARLVGGSTIKYPNLTAEYECGNISLNTFANHAHVTEELMQGILYGNESATSSELNRLRILLNQYGKCCTTGYLGSPTLNVVDPATNKGKVRRAMLRSKLEIAHNKESCIPKMDSLHKRAFRNAEQVCARLSSGKTITYAQYRQAIGGLDYFIQSANTPRPRGLTEVSA